MRALRWSFAHYIMSGALLCAMAMALWPTRALADVFQIDLSESRLRVYDCYTSALSDETLGSDISGNDYMPFYRQVTNLEYQETVSLTYTSSSISGYISPSTEYTETYWKSELFGGTDSALNNPPLVLYIPLGSTVLPKDYRFRVSFDSLGWVLRYLNGSNYQNLQFSANVYRVFSGTSLSDLVECTYSQGGYVANKNSRVVALVLQTTNRTGSRLLENHQYQLYSQISFQIDLPDATAQEINDQSIINTEEINDTIATQTEAQTTQLMDTTGSSSIANGPLSQGQNAYQSFSVNQLVSSVTSNISQAVYSTDADSVVTFPGMSLMGFTIPTVSIDPMTQLPVIADTVKLIVTFTFSAAFLRHIIELVHAIFGIYDYSDSNDMFSEYEKPSNNVYD